MLAKKPNRFDYIKNQNVSVESSQGKLKELENVDNDLASIGDAVLIFNGFNLGYLHDDTPVEYKRTPIVKSYYKRGDENRAAKKKVIGYKNFLEVSLFYSKEKEELFDVLGEHRGTLEIVSDEETFTLDNMLLEAHFLTKFGADGKRRINVKFEGGI